ncbi:MAG: sulfatase, partial [Bacteroidales bacterium]|nr:sulfatase [Bacteroidales bacterium]
LLFIFSDQHSYDMLGCYGNDQVITPNLDKLASEGLLFSNCFTNSPICTPFRGMLMSGQHSLYNGCFTNDVALVPGHGKKFAEVLRDEGYSTAYVGKWHLLGGDRDRPVPPGEMRYGFDELFLTNNCHVDYRPGKCFYWDENDEKVYFDSWEVYGQMNQALAYLDNRKEHDRPFALFVSWHPPHDWGLFEGEDGTKHYNYDTMEEFMELYTRDSIRLRPGMEDTPDLRRMYHGYMAQVSGVDKAFGMLMEKLDEIGEKENTIVVFTADHGDMLEYAGANKPKQYPHDYSLHIPMIIRQPGVIYPGEKTGLLFSSMDLMPTVLGLMDLPIPREVQGKDLAQPILRKDEDAVDCIPIWMYTQKNWRGVITKDYTYSNAKFNETEEELNVLFDRHEDPAQLENHFGNSEYAGQEEELLRLTGEWMDIYGDEWWEMSDFREAGNQGKWVAPPYERPIDLLTLKPETE